MKVLIACEFSGIVRDAFIARGHDAVSCDLLPTERPGPHIQGDVLQHLRYCPTYRQYDLMIAHPPCTYLSFAAMRVWHTPGRAEKREKAFDFFMSLYNAHIPKICVENPKGYPIWKFRKADQLIQPYYFGDSEFKPTCLWLKNLPPLQAWKEDNLFFKKTYCDKPQPIRIDKRGRKMYALHEVSTKGTGKSKGHLRSKFFQGIANAMAEQWG